MPRIFEPYRVLQRMPGLARFVAATYLARLGQAMLSVSTIVMVAARKESYAVAGLVSLVGFGSAALAGPLLARAIDRFGQRRVAAPAGLTAIGALIGLIVATTLGAPTWVLLAFNSGCALMPSIGTLVRSRWAHLLAGDAPALHIVNSFEQALEESCFMLGPAIGAALATLLFPEAGVTVAVTLLLIGLVSLIGHTASEPPIQRKSLHHTSAAFRAPGLLQLAVSLSLTGAMFGSVDVVVLAFSQERDASAWGGLVIGLFAGGSLLGGLVYGTLPVTGEVAGRIQAGTFVMFALSLPLLLVPNLTLLAGNAILVGLAIAPTLITSMILAQRLVPPSQINEGMTIVLTGLLIGVAIGSAVAGVAVDHRGPSWAFLVPIAAAATAAALALVSRPGLRRAEHRALALWGPDAPAD